MLSLVTKFISASVSVALGLPRKPMQCFRGMLDEWHFWVSKAGPY